MFQTVIRALRVKEIRRRFYYLFFCMAVIRFGSQIPVPGVNRAFFANWFSERGDGSFNLFNAFTGGSFESMSILALGITPYITASIIVELLTVAIPALEEMQREGDRKKLTAITRRLSVGLAAFEALAMAVGFGRQGLIPGFGVWKAAVVVLSLASGAAFLMWLGEQITEKGIGNGISIVLLINILSRVPSGISAMYEQFVKGKTLARGALSAAIVLAACAASVLFVVFLEGSLRRVTVQYSRKSAGRRDIGGVAAHIPFKVNTAGVIPVIFASSVISLPGVIAAFAGKSGAGGIPGFLLALCSQSRWFDPAAPVYTAGALLYVIMIFFFAYFYTSITYNPAEIADNLRKQGGVVPGVRPGKPTEEHLSAVLNGVVFIGAAGLSLVVLVPSAVSGLAGAALSLGGTSIIIVCGVLLESAEQLEALMAAHNYKGFLRG